MGNRTPCGRVKGPLLAQPRYTLPVHELDLRVGVEPTLSWFNARSPAIRRSENSKWSGRMESNHLGRAWFSRDCRPLQLTWVCSPELCANELHPRKGSSKRSISVPRLPRVRPSLLKSLAQGPISCCRLWRGRIFCCWQGHRELNSGFQFWRLTCYRNTLPPIILLLE